MGRLPQQQRKTTSKYCGFNLIYSVFAYGENYIDQSLDTVWDLKIRHCHSHNYVPVVSYNGIIKAVFV